MLNHRITLLRRAAGVDALNQPIDTWTALPDLFADVRFQSGLETLRAGAEVSVVRASIRVRARNDIDSSMRVRYLGVDYDIKAVLPDSADRRFMFLICEAAR